jgi:translation initiation factor 1 (eIF-1/SUI1)
MAALTCQWCSQASALQRAGRAGRVAPGTVVHLFTEDFFNSIPVFEEAEMLRLPLEKAVLRVKLLLSRFGNPTELLAESLSPPPPGRISDAIQTLYELGALVSANECSAVTFLGSYATCMPVDLQLVRLILLGVGLNCCTDAVVMAAAMSLQDIFLMPSTLCIRKMNQYSARLASNLQARIHFDNGAYSEPLSYLASYKAWLLSNRTVKSASALGLSHSRVIHLDILVSDLAERVMSAVTYGCQHIQLSRLLSCARKKESCQSKDLDGIFSQDTELLRFVLASACAPNFLIGKPKEINNCPKKPKSFVANRTVHIKKLESSFCSEAVLRAALNNICLKVSKCKLDGNKAWIELEETLKLDCDDPTDLFQPTEVQVPVHTNDACAATKFIGLLLVSYRKKLCLPNPESGSRAAPDSEIMLGEIVLGQQVKWRLEADPSAGKVYTYWRSPLGTVCNYGIGSIYGVAHSILGGEECVHVGGVTMFRTGHYSKIMQFAFPKRSSLLTNLQVRVPHKSLGRVVGWSITAFRDGVGDAKTVSFAPQSLDAQDLECVNGVRFLVNQMLERGPQRNVTARTREVYFKMLQLLQRAPPQCPVQAEPADTVWIKCPCCDLCAVWPLIDTSLLPVLVDAALRQRKRPKSGDIQGSNNKDLKADSSFDFSQDSVQVQTGYSANHISVSSDELHNVNADYEVPNTGLAASTSSIKGERSPISCLPAASAISTPGTNSGPPGTTGKDAAAGSLSVLQSEDLDLEATVHALVEHIQSLMLSNKGKRSVRLMQVNKMVRSAKSKGGPDLLAMVRGLDGRVCGLSPNGIVSSEFFEVNPTPFQCRTEFGESVVIFKSCQGEVQGVEPCGERGGAATNPDLCRTQDASLNEQKLNLSSKSSFDSAVQLVKPVDEGSVAQSVVTKNVAVEETKTDLLSSKIRLSTKGKATIIKGFEHLPLEDAQSILQSIKQKISVGGKIDGNGVLEVQGNQVKVLLQYFSSAGYKNVKKV